MKINGIVAYIKLKIEEYNNEEQTVCLSFHKDIKFKNKGEKNYEM